MSDLKTTLRSYVEQTIERVDADDVLARTGGPHRSPNWRRRPVPVLVMSGLLTIALLGGGVILADSLRTDAAPSATTVPAPATTAPSTAPTTTSALSTTTPTAAPPLETVLPPLPPELAMTWAQLASSPDMEGGAMSAVTPGGPGLVAVGGSRQGDAAVWTSSDGVVWERIDSDSFRAEPDAMGMDGSQSMSDVVNGPLGLVAVGFDEHRVEDRNRMAIWTSSDGRTWSRVPDDPQIFGGEGAEAWAVVYGGPGLVAVGQADGAAAVWGSSDGRTWERTEDIEGAEEALMADVVEFEGRLIAVGSTGRGELAGWRGLYSESGALVQPAVWVSGDGWTWELLPSVAALDDARPGIEIGEPSPGTQGDLQSIAVTDDGLFAVGSWFSEDFHWQAGNGAPQVWRSVDGTAFTMVPSAFEQSQDVFPTQVTAAGARLILLSEVGAVYGRPNGVWGSIDGGATWYRLAEVEVAQPEFRFQAAQLADVFALEGAILVVGSGTVLVPEGEGGGDCYWQGGDLDCRTDAAVWVATFGTED